MAGQNRRESDWYEVTAIKARDALLDFEKIVTRLRQDNGITLQVRFLRKNGLSARRSARAVRALKKEDRVVLYLAYQHGSSIFAYLEKRPDGKLYISLV